MELRKTQARVIEAQWKAFVESLREAGSLDNCIVICDVSGWAALAQNETKITCILPAISLSPFNAGFITFSAQPQLV